MADGALRKGVSDAPGRARVMRSVDVDFIAAGIVEVLSPEDAAIGNLRDVEGAGAAGDPMRDAKLSITGSDCEDRARYSSYESTGGQNSQRMKTISEEAGGKTRANGEIAFPAGPEGCDRLPFRELESRFDVGPEEFVTARGIQSIAGPREGAEVGKTSDTGRGGGALWIFRTVV